MFADHYQFPVLVMGFDGFGDQAVAWFFVFGLVADPYGNFYRVTDKDGADKTQAFVSIGHGDFIDMIGRQSDGDTKNEGAMCDPFLKRLCLAPFFIHVMGKEITGLAGMEDDIRFRDGAAGRLPDMVDVELFKILLQPHKMGGAFIKQSFP
jgi:hypothetical protein